MSVLHEQRRRLQDALLWLDEKPLVVVLAAAGATLGTVAVLCSYAGWTPVLHLVFAPHAWAWLLVCLLGEVVAYGGYALTIRDMSRVDDGGDMTLGASAKVVVGGFGVFAATRGSGGFAVDYWAFRATGARRREAVTRVLGLGFLEYAVLSVAALVASVLLFFGLDGRAGEATTLPSLVIVPAAAIALWATSPTRVRRLSRPRSGAVRRRLANGVAGAAYVRRLRREPARARPRRARQRDLLGGRHPLPVGCAALRRQRAPVRLGPGARVLGRLRAHAPLAPGRRRRAWSSSRSPSRSWAWG